MVIDNIYLSDHFIKRIKQRKIPFDLVVECIKMGKKIINNRNVVYFNDFIVCCMGLVDEGGITVKLNKPFKKMVMRDVRRYGTSKNKIVKMYFESLGYAV